MSFQEQSYYSGFVVSVKNVNKSYAKDKYILQNASMAVERGIIYGLLGSSGCGKTTLLSCIVGLKTWDSGKVLLFGKEPNGPPGKRVGYMPQEIALYNEVSIRETIQYFGRLYGMSADEIKTQFNWIIKFLQLPSEFKLIRDCSGGMKRRVSLAVTMMHNPQLLILDEPTVGLDPLLRENIWLYLNKMTITRKTTVIITTHYIEEARNANKIGIMRKGRILVENSPASLLQQYKCTLLEECVLKLCREDTSKYLMPNNKRTHNQIDKRENFNSVTLNSTISTSEASTSESYSKDNLDSGSSAFGRIRAMTTVIWFLLTRHPVFLVSVLFLPSLQLVITLLVVGKHPNNLQFGVVNLDTQQYDTCFKSSSGEILLNYNHSQYESGCRVQDLSCIAIEHLSKSGIMKLTPMESAVMARNQVVEGKAFGYILFPRNYSTNLANLVAFNKFADNETLEGTRIHIFMDMSTYLAAAMAYADAFKSHEAFAKNVAALCGLNPKQFELPLMYRKSVYGKDESTYSDYMIPMMLLTVILEVSTLITALMFISDRRQGTLDRARVAGLCYKEVLISHFVAQVFVVAVQTVICSMILHFFWSFRIQGSYVLYAVLVFLSGFVGQAMGFLGGQVFNSEVEVIFLGTWLTGFTLVYDGSFGSLYEMETFARYIAYCSPTTFLVESIRGVVYRGVGLFHRSVWPGAVVATAWCTGAWIVSMLIIMKNNR